MRKSYLSDDSNDSDDSDDPTPTPSKYKILLLGAAKCGKTSFITRLTKGYFTLFYTPTKLIEIHREVKIGNMTVELWDIPPRINYHFKLSSLRADAVILMFNTSDLNSKDTVQKMWQKMYKQLPKLPYVFLVGVHHGDVIDNIPGVSYIDNMSTHGYNQLLFHIQKTLTKVG